MPLPPAVRARSIPFTLLVDCVFWRPAIGQSSPGGRITFRQGSLDKHARRIGHALWVATPLTGNGKLRNPRKHQAEKKKKWNIDFSMQSSRFYLFFFFLSRFQKSIVCSMKITGYEIIRLFFYFYWIICCFFHKWMTILLSTGVTLALVTLALFFRKVAQNGKHKNLKKNLENSWTTGDYLVE